MTQQRKKLAGLVLVIAVIAGCALWSPDHTITGQVFVVTQGRENVRLGLVNVQLLTLQAARRHIESKRTRAETERSRLKDQLDASDKLIAEARTNLTRAEKQESYRYNALFERTGSVDSHEFDRALGASTKATNTKNAQRNILSQYLDMRRDLEGEFGYWDSGTYYLEGLPQPVVTATTDANGDFTITVPGRGGPFVLAAHTQRKVFDGTEEYSWFMTIPKEATKRVKVLLSNETMTTAGSPLSLLRTSR